VALFYFLSQNAHIRSFQTDVGVIDDSPKENGKPQNNNNEQLNENATSITRDLDINSVMRTPSISIRTGT
jgi:hypothetical protein